MTTLYCSNALVQQRHCKVPMIFIVSLLLFLQPARADYHFVASESFKHVDRILFNGKLVNETGDPLSGCTITEKGGKVTSQSKADGSFSIEVSGPNAVLVVTYVGYETQEIKVGNLNNLTITLSPSASSLDQVVVVGYSSQKKAILSRVPIFSRRLFPTCLRQWWVVFLVCWLFSEVVNRVMMKQHCAYVELVL